MSQLLQDLRALPLFARLAEPDFAKLAATAVIKRVARNEIVCSKGDPAHSMYVLLEGQLRIFEVGQDGREVGLNYLVAPAIFGEMGVIDDEPRLAHVMAVMPSRIALLPKGQVMQVMTGTPQAAVSMFRHLTAMVRKVTAHQNVLALPTVTQRLCAVLLDMGRKTPQHGCAVLNVPSQKELAIIVKSSRETVSRSLARLQEDGLVCKEGRHLVLLDADRLRAMAD